jgi:hypothetical protein
MLTEMSVVGDGRIDDAGLVGAFPCSDDPPELVPASEAVGPHPPACPRSLSVHQKLA